MDYDAAQDEAERRLVVGSGGVTGHADADRLWVEAVAAADRKLSENSARAAYTLAEETAEIPGAEISGTRTDCGRMG